MSFRNFIPDSCQDQFCSNFLEELFPPVWWVEVEERERRKGRKQGHISFKKMMHLLLGNGKVFCLAGEDRGIDWLVRLYIYFTLVYPFFMIPSTFDQEWEPLTQHAWEMRVECGEGVILRGASSWWSRHVIYRCRWDISKNIYLRY